MAYWGDVLKEVQDSAKVNGGKPDLDGIRQRYLEQLYEVTGRAVIVYGSSWLSKPNEGVECSIRTSDVHGLMECCHEVPERNLDLVIHSPGGDPNAAEQMLNYLRTQFDHIRAIVPLAAKSAATMLALGCDEIVLGLHSELGPIDPQLVITTPEGRRPAPAHAILRDFELAKEQITQDVKNLPVWTPILRGYSGGMMEFSRQQIALSQDIVAGWLERYMLRDLGDDERAGTAKEIAEWFGSEDSFDRFRTHSRPVRIEDLTEWRERGLRITPLEEDDGLQDAVLSVFHALELTFNGPAAKIIENHLGRRYVRLVQKGQLVIQPPGAPGAGQPRPGPAATGPGLGGAAPAAPAVNRQQRRQQQRRK